MSVRLLGLAFYSELPPHLKLLLLALADEANDDGRSICIGQARLARKIGASERTARDNLRRLVDTGLIVKLDGRHPVYRTDQYEILVGALPTPEDVAGRVAPESDHDQVAAGQIAAEDVAGDPPEDVAGSDPLTGSPPPVAPEAGFPLPVTTTHNPQEQVATLPVPAADPSDVGRVEVVGDRRRDQLMFEAVCLAFGINWEVLPPRSPARGTINAQIPELLAFGIYPTDVRDYVEWLRHSQDSPLVSGRRLTIGSLSKWAPYWKARPLSVDKIADAAARAAVDQELADAVRSRALASGGAA